MVKMSDAEYLKYQEMYKEKCRLAQYCRILEAEKADALRCSGENAKAWQECVEESAIKRTHLLAEIGLGEQLIATLRAELASMRERLAAAEADSRRLDWREKQRHCDPFITGTIESGFRVWTRNSDDTVSKSRTYKTYRAAIDAAGGINGK